MLPSTEPSPLTSPAPQGVVAVSTVLEPLRAPSLAALADPAPARAAPQGAAEDERTVLAALAHALLLQAVRRGLDPDELCAAAGCRPSDLGDPDRQIAAPWLCGLLRAIRERLPGSALELEAAQRTALERLGYLGYALEHAPNAFAGLQTLVTYARWLDSALAMRPLELTWDARTVRLAIGAPEASPEWVEASMLGVLAVVSALGPEPRPAVEARLALPKPFGAKLAALGATPIQTAAGPHALVFDRAALERPNPRADDGAARMFRAQLDKMVEQLEQPFVIRVSRAIAAMLARGDLSQRRLGRQLALSPRSLQRKLQQHGLTYSALVEDTRREYASRLLLDRAHSIAAVAAALGYRDASSFTRVFKRWTGMGPRRYRSRHQAPPSARTETVPPIKGLRCAR